MEQKKETETGTIRITRDLEILEKTNKSWKTTDRRLDSAIRVINLFKANGNFKFLIDKKNPRFLKGQLTKDGKCQGARINILPDGKILDKAYSLVAKNLEIHDESSHSHWDVIYENPNGKYAYLYTLGKRNSKIRKKYHAVEELEKYYPKLEHNVNCALKDRNDSISLAMCTLLKTFMRVGNEIYYKTNGHKGLTTIKKSDISITGNNVTFNYLGKDGVPMKITEKFPKIYTTRLREALRNRKNSDFVFTNKNGHPLNDMHFKEAFKKYCGKEFYPHIIRSYYATEKTKEFLKEHNQATRAQVNELFNMIAEKLGHRRFDKKTWEWKDNPSMTIHHYVQPELVEKVRSIVK